MSRKNDIVFALLVVVLVAAAVLLLAGCEETQKLMVYEDLNGSEGISEPSVFNEGEILKELDKIAERYPYILSIEPSEGGKYDIINVFVTSQKWRDSEPQVKDSLRRTLKKKIQEVISDSGYPTTSVKVNIIVEAY